MISRSSKSGAGIIVLGSALDHRLLCSRGGELDQRTKLHHLCPSQPRVIQRELDADRTLAIVLMASGGALLGAGLAVGLVGAATVLFHSIFWQYLPQVTQAAIRAALAIHGAAATRAAPLSWLRMEPAEGAPASLVRA